MKKTAFSAVLLALLLAGCGGVYKPFELMDDRAQVKPGTLAVIAGDASEPTPLIAQALTKQLKDRSTFRVLSQDEVARRLGKYPVLIKRTDPENEDRPVWYAKGEKAKIDALQEKIKADYLFIVWTGRLNKVVTQSSQGGSSVSYEVGVVGNVIEYPKTRTVGYSNFGRRRSQTCCLFGKSEGEDINELLKEAGTVMADEFISATKSERPGK